VVVRLSGAEVIHMGTVQHIGWGMVGAGTTMLARRVVRQLLYRGRKPRLPRAARQSRSVAGLLMFAASSGAVLAIADMLQDQRSHVAKRALT